MILLIKIAVLGSPGPSFSHYSGYENLSCFHVAFKIAFFADLGRFWPPNGVPFGIHFRRLGGFWGARAGVENET